METDCRFRRECAQHSSAGEYREESGFTPELYKDLKKGLIYCDTIEVERCQDLGKSEFPHNHNDRGNGYTLAIDIPDRVYHDPVNPKQVDKVEIIPPTPLTITIQDGNYEQLQEFIVNLGGCFQRKEKLENMTIKQIIDLLSSNVRQTTNINFKLILDKK